MGTAKPRARLKQLRSNLARKARRPDTFPVLAGIILGPIIGLLTAGVSGLSGLWFNVSISTIATTILGLVIALRQRNAIGLLLSEVKVSIPQFSEWKFVVNTLYRAVAWKLFIETMTRVSTQPLDTEHGFVREALNSLYALFTTTRELLKTLEPSKAIEGDTVEMLAMRMLNQELRPFLSKWHPALKRFEASERAESEWTRNKVCRRDLESLRERLVGYGRAFGELAGVRQLDKFF